MMKPNTTVRHRLSMGLNATFAATAFTAIALSATVLSAIALPTSLNAATSSTQYSYYSSTPKAGLLHTIDGPRTDVIDITTMDYDNQGNLNLVTNAGP